MIRKLVIFAVLLAVQANPDPHQPAPRSDNMAPCVPDDLIDAILIVSKTNGWRHIEHIPTSNRVLADIARDLGRGSYVTENAAIFNDAQLRHFAVVVLNSVSGEFLTPGQRRAFARFVARGGGVVALHAAGDDSHTSRWYRDTIVGAPFIGHPGEGDQFQPADMIIDQPQHPVMAGISLPWQPIDEWYSFSGNPADRGMTVLARIDETTYRPGPRLKMGDHPVIWMNPRTKGRVIYSALGHTPQSYEDPNYRRILVNAVRWTARIEPEARSGT